MKKLTALIAMATLVFIVSVKSGAANNAYAYDFKTIQQIKKNLVEEQQNIITLGDKYLVEINKYCKDKKKPIIATVLSLKKEDARQLLVSHELYSTANDYYYRIDSIWYRAYAYETMCHLVFDTKVVLPETVKELVKYIDVQIDAVKTEIDHFESEYKVGWPKELSEEINKIIAELTTLKKFYEDEKNNFQKIFNI